ncbi:hypothetical protein K0M31_011745 [Melipona bicolor]|uniref:Uncharacterized protein n=1 Tax=Melipona bicolor TaxID=60889 RepID=A0AA40GAE9_9HYME|nr:hypothetical protein K0M31_011745 [Melipona bicolor]
MRNEETANRWSGYMCGWDEEEEERETSVVREEHEASSAKMEEEEEEDEEVEDAEEEEVWRKEGSQGKREMRAREEARGRGLGWVR